MNRIGRRTLSLPAAVIGMGFVVLSLTPSLLPRPSWGQGFVSGMAFGMGYVLGLGLWRLIGVWWPGTARNVRRFPSWVALAACLVLVLAFAPLAMSWQNGVRAEVGITPIAGAEWFVFFLFLLVGAWLAFAIGRGLKRVYGWTRRRTARWSGQPVSAAGKVDTTVHRPRAIAIGLVASVLAVSVGAVATGVVVWVVAEQLYNVRNSNYDPDFVQPESPLRSGSPESLVTWQDIGQAGAKVVAGGPSVALIEAVTGGPAVEPIRVYVGMDSPGDAQAHAQLEVEELKRTHAQEREVLVIASPTGSGWLDAAALDSIEYLHRGDTAIAAIQYGATPSAVSAILTPEVSKEAAKASFDAVYGWWQTLPQDSRPQLVVYGLSLGSYSMNSVFTSAEDLMGSTQGAVLMGTPSYTPLWNAIGASRDAGSPITVPVIDDGVNIRFGAQAGDLASNQAPWEQPHITYLQHGTDPVVWIGPSVIWSEPEWLKPGQRSDEVSKDMFWVPVLTAVQGLIDLATSTAVPEDAGHKYGNIALDAFNEVTGNDDLTDAQLELILSVISQYDTYSPVSN